MNLLGSEAVTIRDTPKMVQLECEGLDGKLPVNFGVL